jgi:enoyl-CoA hydratase/carnithine racemase
MIDDVVGPNDVRTRAREAAAALTGLDRTAYATTKRRMRSRAVAWAEENLEAEMVALPVRAGG